MDQEFKLTDVVGFRKLLDDAILGKLSDVDVLVARDRLNAFCDNYAKLDAWKLKHERAGRWQPGQPCMHRGSPCVTVSVSATRVMAQKWTLPQFKLDHPVTPKPVWVDPANLVAIHTRATWDTWRGMMEFCGQMVDEWTTSEFRARIEGV